MQVLCERCQTEYDFDDALVSERGTTVKCTTCGHQFRVFRRKAAGAAPERWAVHTRTGNEIVFTSLRALQQAIASGQVDRNDTLVRDGLAPRRLSAIAELEPFFASAETVRATPVPGSPAGEALARKDGPTTSPGLGTTPAPPRVEDPRAGFQATMASAAFPPSPAGASNVAPEPMVEQQARARVSPLASTQSTASRADLLGEEPGFAATMASGFVAPQAPHESHGPVRAHHPMRLGAIQRIPPTSGRSIRDQVDPSLTPTPSDVRASYSAYDEAPSDVRYTGVPSQRSAAARWLIVFVLAGALVVVAVAFGHKYVKFASSGTAASASVDPRVSDLLRQADRLMLDGDLDGAKEAADKASVLAERDPGVLVLLARWMNVSADLVWLKLRLTPPDQIDAVGLVRRELEQRARRALEAAQRAADVAPNDRAVTCARVDAFRIAGDISSGRKNVAQLSTRTAEPEVAYVLAALEIGEPTPNWTSAIDRLRLALVGEQNLGRARSALVYALAVSGQNEAAAVEFDVLSRMPRPHPLLVELKAFLARQALAKKTAAVPSASSATPDAAPVPAVAAGPGVTPGEVGEAAPGSYQELLHRAHAAKAAGDNERAEQLYRAVLAKNPQDTEALAGLGDLAKAKGDHRGSVGYYEEVQKQNPSYLPALIGLADAKWEAGDKAGAVVLYRQVIDRVGGQGPYADRARQRIASASQGAPPSNTSSATAPKPSPTPTTTATSTTPPGVDTSDLPGWKP